MDEPLQLRSDILQTAAPAVVASLAALEGVANPSAQCAEWVARVFLQPAEGVDPMRNAAALAPRFDSLLCRSHVKPACAHLDARAARALRGACALVLSGSVALLDDRDGESDGGGRRIAALLAAVARELPALEGRLKFGADVTIRRSCGQHDLMTTNGKHAAGAGGAAGAAAGAAGGAAGVDAAAKGSAHGNSARQQHPDAAIHCDSFDGSILCFGLCSTKLGTPVYPEARFPSPLQMFLAQSRSGKNHPFKFVKERRKAPRRRSAEGARAAPAYEGGSPKELAAHVGPRRSWTAGTLVAMPACVAHSKPDPKVQPDDEPAAPRWFSRATLRLAVAKGADGARVTERERLQLCCLVCEHIWGDAAFAGAARAGAGLPVVSASVAAAEEVRPREAPSNTTSSEGEDVEHKPGPAARSPSAHFRRCSTDEQVFALCSELRDAALTPPVTSVDVSSSAVSRAAGTALLAALQSNRALTALDARGTPLLRNANELHREIQLLLLVPALRAALASRTECDLADRGLGDEGAERLAVLLLRPEFSGARLRVDLRRNEIKGRGGRALETMLHELQVEQPLQLALDVSENWVAGTAVGRRLGSSSRSGGRDKPGAADAHAEEAAFAQKQRADDKRPTTGSVKAMLAGTEHRLRVKARSVRDKHHTGEESVQPAAGEQSAAEGHASHDTWSLFLSLGSNTVLVSLDLRKCRIGASGAASLAAGLATNVALRELFLFDNALCCDGAECLARCLAGGGASALVRLNLCSNGIGARGAAALAIILQAAPPHGKLLALESLDLNRNQVGDAGATLLLAAMAKIAPMAQHPRPFRTLSLQQNGVTESAAPAILTALSSLQRSCDSSGAVSASVDLRYNELSEATLNAASELLRCCDGRDTAAHLDLSGFRSEEEEEDEAKEQEQKQQKQCERAVGAPSSALKSAMLLLLLPLAMCASSSANSTSSCGLDSRNPASGDCSAGSGRNAPWAATVARLEALDALGAGARMLPRRRFCGSGTADAASLGDCLSEREFRSSYLGKQPVLISGLLASTAGWPAPARWEAAAFVREYGSVKVAAVPVELASQTGRTKVWTRRRNISSLVSTLLRGPGAESKRCFVFERPQPHEQEQDVYPRAPTPRVLAPISPSGHVAPDPRLPPARWDVLSIGGEGDGIGFHTHGDAWLGSGSGRKAWFVVAPGGLSAEVRGDPIGGSRAWAERTFLPSVDAAAGAGGASRAVLFAVQRPGDVVYMPAGWAHSTLDLDPVVIAIGAQESPGGSGHRELTEATADNNNDDSPKVAMVKRLRQPAEAGDVAAQSDLGSLLMSSDRGEAVEWLNSSALSHPRALTEKLQLAEALAKGGWTAFADAHERELDAADAALERLLLAIEGGQPQRKELAACGWLRLGSLRLAAGRLAAAGAAAKRSLSLEPNCEAAFVAGRALEKAGKGQSAEAKAHFANCLAIAAEKKEPEPTHCIR